MGKWFKLVQNEWMKVIRKKSTLVMLILLFVAVITMGGILKWDTQTNPPKQTWEQAVQQEITQAKKRMQGTSPDSAQYENLQNQIKASEYRLENDIAPVQKGTFWWFMEQSQGLFNFITLFTIIASAGIVASEFTTGTIKLLVIRPVNRWKVLYSKYVTTLMYGVFMTALLIALSAIVGAILFPSESVTALNVTNGEVMEYAQIWEYLKWFEYSFVGLVIFAALAFMISTVFRSNALAIGITMFLMFTGPQVTMLLSRYDWAQYVLFAHTDFTQFLTNNVFIQGLTPVFSLTVLAVYFFFFHLLSLLLFTKRDIAV